MTATGGSDGGSILTAGSCLHFIFGDGGRLGGLVGIGGELAVKKLVTRCCGGFLTPKRPDCLPKRSVDCVVFGGFFRFILHVNKNKGKKKKKMALLKVKGQLVS